LLRPSLFDCPSEFRKIVEECWSSKPQYRPTFDEIIEKLGRLNIKTTDNPWKLVFSSHFDDRTANDFGYLFEKNGLIIDQHIESIDHSLLQSMGIIRATDRMNIIKSCKDYLKKEGISKEKVKIHLIVEISNQDVKSVVVEVCTLTELKCQLKEKIESFKDIELLNFVYYDNKIETYADLENIRQLGDPSRIRLKSSHFSHFNAASEKETQSCSQSSIFDSANLTNVRRETQIGKGNFGTIYKGKHGLTPIVMKKLEKDHLKELEKEANILKRLSNPNIVRFVGVCELDGVKYMCMELFNDGSLEDFMKLQKEKLNNTTLVNMASTAAQGMEFLSFENIIHRDLAARNLLVSHNGQDYILKVSDFGLAVALEKSTYHFSNLFPIRWTAIEGIEKNLFFLESDVWSFGVVLWEMFTRGEYPYKEIKDSNIKEFLLKGCRLSKPEDCPDKIYDLMLRCWNQSYKDRPSFKEIHNVLVPDAINSEENNSVEQQEKKIFFIKYNSLHQIKLSTLHVSKGFQRSWKLSNESMKFIYYYLLLTIIEKLF